MEKNPKGVGDKKGWKIREGTRGGHVSGVGSHTHSLSLSPCDLFDIEKPQTVQASLAKIWICWKQKFKIIFLYRHFYRIRNTSAHDCISGWDSVCVYVNPSSSSSAISLAYSKSCCSRSRRSWNIKWNRLILSEVTRKKESRERGGIKNLIVQ